MTARHIFRLDVGENRGTYDAPDNETDMGVDVTFASSSLSVKQYIDPDTASSTVLQLPAHVKHEVCTFQDGTHYIPTSRCTLPCLLKTPLTSGRISGLTYSVSLPDTPGGETGWNPPRTEFNIHRTTLTS